MQYIGILITLKLLAFDFLTMAEIGWVTEGGVEYWATSSKASKNKYDDILPIDFTFCCNFLFNSESSLEINCVNTCAFNTGSNTNTYGSWIQNNKGSFTWGHDLALNVIY